MTPELKSACELVFQEHKTISQPITWNKDAFHGRISIGLREMAKETLVSKHIIYFPNRAKKTVTLLNPEVATATSYEEAVDMAVSKKVETPVMGEDIEMTQYDDDLAIPPVTSSGNRRLVKIIAPPSEPKAVPEKWYLRPLFFYFIWPVTAAILGVASAWLLSELIATAWRR